MLNVAFFHNPDVGSQLEFMSGYLNFHTSVFYTRFFVTNLRHVRQGGSNNNKVRVALFFPRKRKGLALF